MGKTKQKKFIKRASKSRFKKNIKMTKKTTKLVAVYGTLRKGQGNNVVLKKAKQVGEFWTEPKFSMFPASHQAFPYAMQNGHSSILLEVWSFDDSTTEEDLDRLEGVSTGLYVKDSIKTPHGDAIFYTRKVKMDQDDKLIASGDWIEYKKTGE